MKIIIKMKKGITLISLVVTIVVLLILAGVVIATLQGENGILSKALNAKEQTVQKQLEEEIELSIIDLKTEELSQGKTFNMQSIIDKLPVKLDGITIQKSDSEAIGEYKDYEYTIKENYTVEVRKKIQGEKPYITYLLNTEVIGVTQVTITINANVNNGSITKIIKPDGSIEENVGQINYTVTKSGKYIFTAESSNGKTANCIVEITNILPSQPVIESNLAYAKVTIYGTETAKIIITYDDNSKLINSYSQDGGTTWKEYTGPFEPTNSVIKAKSEFRENPVINAQSEKNVSKTDAVTPEAFDGNESSYSIGIGKYILIDESMYTKKIRISLVLNNYSDMYLQFLDINKQVITQVYYHSTYATECLTVVPEGTKYFTIKYNSGTTSSTGYIREIGPSNRPIIASDDLLYPELRSDGISNRNLINIEYAETSVQKLYSRDQLTWDVYPEEGVIVLNGQTVYLKGIDKNGKDSLIATYKNTKTDIMPIEGYDNNESTYTSGLNRFIVINSDMQNKQAKLKFNSPLYSRVNVRFLNSGKVVTSSFDIVNQTFNNTITIPADARWITFVYTDGDGSKGNLYEIQPVK